MLNIDEPIRSIVKVGKQAPKYDAEQVILQANAIGKKHFMRIVNRRF